jgi:hypothetical protein
MGRLIVLAGSTAGERVLAVALPALVLLLLSAGNGVLAAESRAEPDVGNGVEALRSSLFAAFELPAKVSSGLLLSVVHA